MVTEFLRKLADRVPVPRSLLGRMLLLTLLAVLFAQALSSVIWVSQLRATQLEGLVTSARSLAHSMTASVSYFRSLPVAFRPLVLDQLRSMGGTRFVVTLNDKPLGMEVLPITPRKEAVLKAVDEVLRQSLGQDTDISVTFVSPEDLRIFNGGLKLDELPRSWAHYALDPGAGEPAGAGHANPDGAGRMAVHRLAVARALHQP